MRCRKQAPYFWHSVLSMIVLGFFCDFVMGFLFLNGSTEKPHVPPGHENAMFSAVIYSLLEKGMWSYLCVCTSQY